MRTPSRHALALALGAVLLGGCSSGGSPDHSHGSAAGSPSAHTSDSARRPAPAAPAAPARPWDTHPASVAALGDSITRGFDACKPLSDCPEVSWATGTRSSVDSLTQQLAPLTAGAPATRGWNLAATGARAADLPAQARAAAAYKPAMVTILIGANDACTSSPATMTPVADFRARVSSTLAYLHKALPKTQVLVASIPDLRRLWQVGRGNPVGERIWKLGLCPSMLADPDSDSAAATARRTSVRDRVVAYNTALGQVCAAYQRCRYDGGAVFRYPFGADALSSWDFFHPNPAGQRALAAVLAPVVLGRR